MPLFVHPPSSSLALALYVALSLLLAAPLEASAQERNASIFARMLLDCVAPELKPGPPLIIDLPDEAGFAAPDIVAAFLDAGRSVVLPDERTRLDSLAAPDSETGASLAIQLDDASVAYTRSGRRVVERTVNLRAHYLARTSNEVVSASDRCEYSESDQVRRADIGNIEDPAFPATVGEGPGRSRLSRILTPVVAAGAVVVSAYLLFALRSESGSDS